MNKRDKGNARAALEPTGGSAEGVARERLADDLGYLLALHWLNAQRKRNADLHPMTADSRGQSRRDG